MAEDVFASVPYHFTSGETAVGGAYRLVWPLFIATSCVDPNPRTRDWIVQVFRDINNATGNQQALVISKVLSERHIVDFIPGR